MRSETASGSDTRTRAAVVAGVFAGCVYLLLQMAFSAWLRHDGLAAPLQRISAVLLGPSAAPPATDLTFVVVAMAVLVHFGLSIIYAALIGSCLRRLDRFTAISLGALLGYGLYTVNFWLIAPSAFPWFLQARDTATAINHVIFGLAATWCYLEVYCMGDSQ